MGGKKTDLPPRSSIILTNKSVFDISSSFLVNGGSCRANGINHRLTSLSFSLPAWSFHRFTLSIVFQVDELLAGLVTSNDWRYVGNLKVNGMWSRLMMDWLSCEQAVWYICYRCGQWHEIANLLASDRRDGRLIFNGFSERNAIRIVTCQIASIILDYDIIATWISAARRATVLPFTDGSFKSRSKLPN